MLDKVTQELKAVVDRYSSYKGNFDSIGGVYYGSAPMITVRSGELEVIHNGFVYEGMFTRNVIVGLQIGSNWYPMPATPKADKNTWKEDATRTQYYQDREKVLTRLKQEADLVFNPLISFLKEQGTKVFSRPMWVYGTAWSAYFVGSV